MNIIAVVVHNRLDNIKQWLHVWKQCKQDAILIIIHNHYNEPGLMKDFSNVVESAGVLYVPRSRSGYDIGAFQDVCRERLEDFPNDWHNLLWCTDDCLPMAKDFGQYFWRGMDKYACVAMEISPYVNRHIRTTGFCITKKAASSLVFPSDPITTKEDCYRFEHRSKNTMYDQLQKDGVIMVQPQAISPLFDFGYHRRLKEREQEHYNRFGSVKQPTQNPVTIIKESKEEWVVVGTSEPIKEPEPQTVTIICPIYDAYPQIVSSLLCQTYQDWVLWLIHDGPNELSLPDDHRIIYIKRERKENDYGHSIRKEYLQKVTTPFVLITNGDNYYAPPFLTEALKAMAPHIVATYCNQIVHSYTAFKVMNCRVERGFIDCGQVVLRTREAQKVGWVSMEHSADWFFFEAIAKKYGANRFQAYRGCLFIHC